MLRVFLDGFKPIAVGDWVIENVCIWDKLSGTMTKVFLRLARQPTISRPAVSQLTLFPSGYSDWTIPSWEQRKFSEIVDVCSGRDYKHLNEGPIPVYGTGGYMTSVCEALSHNRDAVGIGRKGTIDKPYLLKAPFWTVDTLFYAIPKPDINLEFALCSFLNVDWKSKDESTGLPSLSKEAINETVLRVPNVVEQNHLGSFFTDLDSLITLHQREPRFADTG